MSAGAGFLVDTRNPERYETLALFPITGMVQVPKSNLIVFSNFTSACAINQNGQVWSTERLASDYVTLLGVREDVILGSGWDASTQRTVPFNIRSENGVVYEGNVEEHL